MPSDGDRLTELAERAGVALRERGWTVGTAESCTGGLIGHALTDIAGSSDYLLGGVIAYANQVKQALLGVPEELLQTHGAVSREVALAMAHGARRLLGVDVAISSTGIAGPTGGTPHKPVGTVYVAVVSPLGEACAHHVWMLDRVGNKRLSAEAGLELLLTQISTATRAE